MNQENRHKVEEPAHLSGDLQNLLSSMSIATLFLDRELRIQRFTPKTAEMFNVLATDRGRPISDITHRFGYDRLKEDAETVLAELAPIERVSTPREAAGSEEARGSRLRWFHTPIARGECGVNAPPLPVAP